MILTNPTARQLEAAFAEVVAHYVWWFRSNPMKAVLMPGDTNVGVMSDAGYNRLNERCDLSGIEMDLGSVPPYLDDLSILFAIVDEHSAWFHMERSGGDRRTWWVLVWTEATMMTDGKHSAGDVSLAKALVVSMLRFAGVTILLDGETKV